MVSFALGITTRAFFQKSASVAGTSGSVSIARRAWRSLRERIRFQSVPALADVLPVRFSLMSLCPPGRDDSPSGPESREDYMWAVHSPLAPTCPRILQLQRPVKRASQQHSTVLRMAFLASLRDALVWPVPVPGVLLGPPRRTASPYPRLISCHPSGMAFGRPLDCSRPA